jgi:hypothetical protein
MKRPQHVLSKMSRQEVAYHIDRCIKSGLLVQKAEDMKQSQAEQ